MTQSLVTFSINIRPANIFGCFFKEEVLQGDMAGKNALLLPAGRQCFLLECYTKSRAG
jgi:hypothetical protein